MCPVTRQRCGNHPTGPATGLINPYINALLPLAEVHQEATGAVFVLGGRFNSAELYATPALFRQLWPKLLYAMVVEALSGSWQCLSVGLRVGEPVRTALRLRFHGVAWLSAV